MHMSLLHGLYGLDLRAVGNERVGSTLVFFVFFCETNLLTGNGHRIRPYTSFSLKGRTRANPSRDGQYQAIDAK